MNTLREELKPLLLEVRHGAYITPKIEQIIKLFKHHMEEIIGEEEYVPTDHEDRNIAMDRNDLRRELLQKLKEL